jgi:DNA sulfur modification protein DndD
VEQDGRRGTAERRWHPTPTGYRETLSLEEAGERLSDEAADSRLQDLLPRDFLPFFFFDGEDIKSLAEAAEGRKRIDFDRVLRISFINELAAEVVSLATQRERAGLPQQIREELVGVEAEMAKASAAKEAAESALADLQDSLADVQAAQRRAEQKRDTRRAHGARVQPSDIQNVLKLK